MSLKKYCIIGSSNFEKNKDKIEQLVEKYSDQIIIDFYGSKNIDKFYPQNRSYSKIFILDEREAFLISDDLILRLDLQTRIISLSEVHILKSNIKRVSQKFFETNNLKKSIPKIIHFIWISRKTESYPEYYEENIKSFRENNPDFTITIWNGREILKLIKENFPSLVSIFEKERRPKCLYHIARFVIIYLYGGIYSDLDFYCNENLKRLIKNKESFFAKSDCEKLSNKFFGSFCDNPFILEWINTMAKNLTNFKHKHISLESNFVDRVTGEYGFYLYYLLSREKPTLINKCFILPDGECKNIKYYVYSSKEKIQKDYNVFMLIFFIVIFFAIMILIYVYTIYCTERKITKRIFKSKK